MNLVENIEMKQSPEGILGHYIAGRRTACGRTLLASAGP